MTNFSLFSFLHYIQARQPDWQATYTMLWTPTAGVSSVRPTASFTKRDCTDISADQLRAILRAGENFFASAPLTEFEPNPLCFPPRSTLRITSTVLQVENPFVDMRLAARFVGGGPRTKFDELDAEIAYSGLRAHHPALVDYKAWVNRVRSGHENGSESSNDRRRP